MKEGDDGYSSDRSSTIADTESAEMRMRNDQEEQAEKSGHKQVENV